jgi:PAS domain S-box-containing protein
MADGFPAVTRPPPPHEPAPGDRTPLDPSARAGDGTRARMLETLVATIEDFAYLFDREGRFLHANPSLLALWGLSLEQAVGRRFDELPYPAALAARLQSQIEQVVATGERLVDETEYVSPSGSVGHYEYIFVPVSGPGGRVDAVAGTTRDISRRVHAERQYAALLARSQEATQALRQWFEHAPGFVALLRGPDHVFEMANLAYHQLVGHRDIDGRPLFDALPEVRGQGYEELLDAVRSTGEPFIGRDMRVVIQRTPDGPPDEAFVDLIYQPVFDPDGSVSGIFVQGHEVTEQRRSIDALRHSEERYRHAVELNPQIPWTADAHGRIVGCDDRWLALTGMPRDGALGDGAIVALHGEDRVPVRDAWRHAVATGSPFDVEHRTRVADGGFRWMRSAARPQRDGGGRIVQWYGTTEDVDERRRAEQALRDSEARYRVLAELLPQMVFTSRPDGALDYVNPFATRFTGWPAEALLGAGWSGCIHPEHRDRVLGAWAAAIADGTACEVDMPFRRHDGRYRTLFTRAVPVRGDDGSIECWLGAAVDIEDRRQVEEALRATDRRKDEFLAVLAHELRNPLAPLRNSLKLLERESLGERGRTALRVGSRQTAQLARLVDDLLEVSRITRDRIELRPERVMLQAIVYSVAENLAQTLDGRGQRIDFEMPGEPAWVDADPVRLTQVVENLLSNASKYTDSGGRITIALAHRADEVAIAVRDTGIGIAPSDLERVFELFAQLDTSLDRTRGGLGIGLALVRKLVELHGGRVHAHSDGPGRGASFTVALPRRRPIAG